MRKWITFLMTFLVGSVSYVNANYGSAQVNFDAGYRRDELSWSLEVPSCDPLFKVTSRFRDIEIFQIGVRARSNVGCNFYVRASADWGWVLNGDFEESIKVFSSDITGFPDTDVEFKTDSENIVDDKFVADIDIALGYPFYFCDCTMYIAPVIGYGFHEQNINIDDAEELDFFEEDSILFAGSGSGCCTQKQIFRWYAPFVGVDFGYQPCGECWNIWASLEYHIGRFKFKRHHHNFGFSNFNDLDETSRHAHGWVFAAGADYELCNCWSLGFIVKFTDWSATRHHNDDCGFGSNFQSFFGSDDEFKTHASWQSAYFAVSVDYEF